MKPAHVDLLEAGWAADQRAWICLGGHPDSIPDPGVSRGFWAEVVRRVASTRGDVSALSKKERSLFPAAWLDQVQELAPGRFAAAAAEFKVANEAYWTIALDWDGLVVKVAIKMRGRVEEALQAGREGIFRGVVRFDPARKIRFTTYATHWIRASIQRQLWKQASLVSSSPVLAMDAVRLADLETERGPLSKSEVTAYFGWSERHLEMVRQVPLFSRVVSLDAPLEPGSTLTPASAIGGEDPNLEAAGDVALASKALACGLEALTDRERTVVASRFGLDGRAPQTLAQIAQALGLSKERVRQLESQALHTIAREIERRALCLSSS